MQNLGFSRRSPRTVRFKLLVGVWAAFVLLRDSCGSLALCCQREEDLVGIYKCNEVSLLLFLPYQNMNGMITIQVKILW